MRWRTHWSICQTWGDVWGLPLEEASAWGTVPEQLQPGLNRRLSCQKERSEPDYHDSHVSAVWLQVMCLISELQFAPFSNKNSSVEFIKLSGSCKLLRVTCVVNWRSCFVVIIVIVHHLHCHCSLLKRELLFSCFSYLSFLFFINSLESSQLTPVFCSRLMM